MKDINERIDEIWNSNSKIPFMQSKEILRLGYIYGESDVKEFFSSEVSEKVVEKIKKQPKEQPKEQQKKQPKKQSKENIHKIEYDNYQTKLSVIQKYIQEILQGSTLLDIYDLMKKDIYDIQEKMRNLKLNYNL